ncbi:MAG: TonB-dependent receptor [Acidobacteria bacterium]|nr:TonB-dependent receptor [Acidobacteriota bacterium]
MVTQSVLLVFLVAAATAAQTSQGGIRGRVTDAGGFPAVVPLELIDAATGLVRMTTSNPGGEYAFGNVLPGEYRLRAQAPGFKTYERSGLRVGTQTFLTVDVALQLGDVTELVTVEAPVPPVTRANASVGATVDRTSIEGLPSAGRNVFIMATALPTVLATGDAQFVRQQDQSNSSLISLGGGPRRNNSYVIDGVPIVDILNRATLIPNVQAVEEMRVQLSTYDADVGRTSGGVFNVTARSGSNQVHGTALYQNRPDWAMGRLLFAAKNNIENPDTYYHLYGGGGGGPIRRNRTFFWASTEGYRSSTARATVLLLPTDAERLGDFSQSGVTIYDPLTTRPDPARPGQFVRDPFPGNRIPAGRINPVSQALLQYLPMPSAGTLRPAVARIVDRADQLAGKITQRWSDALTSTGLYAWYESMEPDAAFYGGGSLFDNPADPGGGAFVRGAQVVALNTVWTPGSRSVVAVRYGYNDLEDDNRPAPFDPSALGFDPGYLAAVPLKKFPNIGVTDYGRGGSFLGDRYRDRASYYAHTANATLTTLRGRHTVKLGAEYRLTGVRFQNVGGMGGFGFSREFTFGPNPNTPAPGTGDAFASFLLGFPANGAVSVSSPIDVFLQYWSGFAQDDFRVTPRLTLNLGLRYDFETGLRERENRIITEWAFDEPFPIQVGGLRPDGTPLVLTGGVRYAGVDGAPTRQGDPNPWQFAPRLGLAYAFDERTVVRGGYGLFWAPSQGISADEGGTGTTGYNIGTSYVATGSNPFVPCEGCRLTNPFPNGLNQPRGNGGGRLTGVGDSIGFIDPESRLAHVHRYSIDLQRELPHQVAIGVGYLAARGERLMSGIGGWGPNINQLDPQYAALGPALQEPVANPFFGTPLGVGILAGATLPRGQLLRPYPQFDGVYLRRPNLSRSRYHALVLTGERRLSGGWAVHANYTWSRLTDNQFSESNFFAGGSSLMNNYDVEREFGLSVLDTPHVFNLTTIVELPFGPGRRWVKRGRVVDALVGGWTLSVAGRSQAGFPVTVGQSPNNSGLLGSGQRPNIVSGVNPRLARDADAQYDPQCGCIRWLNPAAWSQAAPFTFGDAPRADGRARTPARRLWDVAIQKSHRLGARTVSGRAEIINVFNIPDLRGPNVAFGDPSFGQIREAAGFPRMLQLSAQVAW